MMLCFEGKVSVKALLLAKKREVIEVWVDKNKDDKDTHFICSVAKRNAIPLLQKTREEIDAVASGKTHGGVICFAKNRKYQNLAACLSVKKPFIALIEGIEDPFNLGYVLRTLYSAGCSGVLMNSRDWSSVDPVITKSSAGASEYINVCMVEDLSKAIQDCKEAGCICYSAMRKEAISYYDADFNQPLLLAVGGEMRGLSKVVLQASDQNIYIPYANDFRNALNASSAVAALSFEVVRQRRK